MGDPKEAFLKHYGVKGMKWGVRRDKGHEGERAKTKKIEKLDQQFERNTRSLSVAIAIHNSAADRTNKNDVDRINNKPAYKGQDFTRDSPLRRRYYKEHQDAFLDNVVKAAEELGTNASGTKSYGVVETPNGGWDIFVKDVQHSSISHAEPPTPEFRVKVTYDKQGHIMSLAIVETQAELAQSDVPIGAFLAHYGTKGMKWGVKRNADGTTSKTGKRVKSEDHETARALMKKRPSEMSNTELRKLNERLQLEQSYSQLMTKQGSTVGRGQTYVRNTVGVAKTMSEVYNVINSPAGKATTAVIRGALK